MNAVPRCAECGYSANNATEPTHAFYCPKLAEVHVRDLVRFLELVGDRERKLKLLEGQLRSLGDDGLLAALSCARAARCKKIQWWEYADELSRRVGQLGRLSIKQIEALCNEVRRIDAGA